MKALRQLTSLPRKLVVARREGDAQRRARRNQALLDAAQKRDAEKQR